uniref:Uncharacterized protein n=1 Tax=Setaria viridis TaxID=4556 RepID=A0A4U6U3M5_SETVI|nr:hypothetical protein SEVIR_7G340408v2 [Setaria viridis]
MTDILGDFEARDPFQRRSRASSGRRCWGTWTPSTRSSSRHCRRCRWHTYRCSPARSPSPSTTRAGSSSRSLAGGFSSPSRTTNARAAAVRLKGARQALRPGAHRQDQSRVRRRRPRSSSAAPRGRGPHQPAAASEGRALHALHRRRQPPHQRLHPRRQDRQSQDARFYPQEASPGINWMNFSSFYLSDEFPSLLAYYL